MKKALRFICILLSVILLLTSLGCGSEGTEDTEETGTPVGTADPEQSAETDAPETTIVHARQEISDELPAVSFDGNDFLIMGCYPDHAENVVVEELNGENFNDAIFRRNSGLNERFNTRIQYTTGGVSHHDNATALIEKTILAGDSDAFDLIMYHFVASSGNAVKGLYLNWYDIPDIHFEKPWWSSSNTEDLTVNGRCFLAIGDVSIRAIHDIYCIIYNKDAITDNQEEPLYPVVKNGGWTLDYVRSLSERVYRDVNGNGIEDAGDYFGLLSDNGSNLNAFYWAGGNKVLTKTGDALELTFFNENTVRTYEKTKSLIYGSGVDFQNDPNVAMNEKFLNYQSLMIVACIGQTRTKMGNYEHEYGVLPLPKLAEEQEAYCSMVDGGSEMMAVGKSAVNLKFIGIMTEALCAESYKTVQPVYYDECLKMRYSTSPEDAEMIELCRNSCVYDLGYIYDNWKGLGFLFLQCLQNQSDIASSYEAKKAAAEKYYWEKVLAVFEGE